jgi:ectoine hydroxylase-related dioxygenase (phytanoyl-CoA dioxygenase family)
VDQAPNNPGFQCVQGFVALTDNSKATLGVLPGSHLDFVANTATVPASKRNKRWVKLPLEYSKVVAVQVEAGDLVLWDSRVAHMNFYDPTEERLVQYVSYLPRARATRPDLEKRLKYFGAKRTTSHWAAPLEVVGVQPQTWGNPALRIDYGKVSDPADLAVWLAMENEIKNLV